VTGEKDARESLDQAAYLAQRMRAQGRWHRPLIALLGLAMFAAVLVSGMALPPPLQTAGFTLAVLLLMGLVIYTASRKVIPRHHKLLYSLVTPLGCCCTPLQSCWGRCSSRRCCGGGSPAPS
jgi:hypothetical protein